MGQTLSNGVYLPNEGERNCYAGLASNWQILNTAVGNIAEKAPLVHTHGNISNDGKIGTTANVPLITGTGGVVQAGAFGNQANTFCEGNDSRLSDARTPLSHTHTKSDVTDLLNSNFIPSANNSYDLGSSSYQWNNAYIKSLTINGVACGDILTHNASEFVNVSSNQTIGGVKTFSGNFTVNRPSPRLQTKSTTYSSETSSAMTIADIAFLNKDSGFSTWIVHQLRDDLTKRLCFRVYPHTSATYRGFAFDDNCNLYPENTNSALGTPTNKWKTLNGVNPGALSLPNVRAAVADPVDTVNWNLTGSRNTYTPTEDGWFFIRVAGTGNCAINIHTGSSSNEYPTWLNSSTGGYATLVVPVEKSITLYIYITATSIEYCSFRPCLGNV